jgi:hypothetical protein
MHSAAPHCLAAFERHKVSKRIWQFWHKWIKTEGLRNIESRGLGSVDVSERRQSRNGLADILPAERALVTVVVRWIDAFRYLR